MANGFREPLPSGTPLYTDPNEVQGGQHSYSDVKMGPPIDDRFDFRVISMVRDDGKIITFPNPTDVSVAMPPTGGGRDRGGTRPPPGAPPAGRASTPPRGDAQGRSMGDAVRQLRGAAEDLGGAIPRVAEAMGGGQPPFRGPMGGAQAPRIPGRDSVARAPMEGMRPSRDSVPRAMGPQRPQGFGEYPMTPGMPPMGGGLPPMQGPQGFEEDAGLWRDSLNQQYRPFQDPGMMGGGGMGSMGGGMGGGGYPSFLEDPYGVGSFR